MNLRLSSSVSLAEAIRDRLSKGASCQVAVCPPSAYLHAVGQALRGSAIGLGAQHVAAQPDGAFTGELSTAMLQDVGCSCVIIGHSERRQFFAETDQGVHAKYRAAIAAGLTPIVCVGETLQERESGGTEQVVKTQLDGGLQSLTAAEAPSLVIAYEPVWAIGTGKVATPQQAQDVHAFIRKWLMAKVGSDGAQAVRIQYGGSVKPDNAAQLLALPDVDGALVGGASLKADDFLAIIAAA
jgi:triosephosphate isomerase (TIM)